MQVVTASYILVWFAYSNLDVCIISTSPFEALDLWQVNMYSVLVRVNDSAWVCSGLSTGTNLYFTWVTGTPY
jgi:hypothetical protein